MPGSTNFKRWDEAIANLQSDAEYLAETFRLNGGADGLFPKEVFNKFALQVAAMVTALAEMMVAKGYTVEDGSAGTAGHDYNALIAVLSNIITAVETSAAPAASKVVKFGTDKGINADGIRLTPDVSYGSIDLGRFSEVIPYGYISAAQAGNADNTGVRIQTKDSGGSSVVALSCEPDGNLKASSGNYLSDGNVRIHTKIIDIGDWNMDASGTPVAYPLNTGIDGSKIRSISVAIRTDADAGTKKIHDLRTPNNYPDAPALGGHFSVDPNTGWVFLIRTAGGPFDSADYNSTSYNRGWVTITYVD